MWQLFHFLSTPYVLRYPESIVLSKLCQVRLKSRLTVIQNYIIVLSLPKAFSSAAHILIASISSWNKLLYLVKRRLKQSLCFGPQKPSSTPGSVLNPSLYQILPCLVPNPVFYCYFFEIWTLYFTPLGSRSFSVFSTTIGYSERCLCTIYLFVTLRAPALSSLWPLQSVYIS